MNFHRYRSSYHCLHRGGFLKKGTAWDQMYEESYISHNANGTTDNTTKESLQRRGASYKMGRTEHLWYKRRRPYYNVWPAIIPILLKTDLSKIPSTSLKLPITPLSFNFPVEIIGTKSEDPLTFTDPKVGEFRVRSVLVSEAFATPDQWDLQTLQPAREHGFFIMVDPGEEDVIYPRLPYPCIDQKKASRKRCGFPHINWISYRRREGWSVEKSMEDITQLKGILADGVSKLESNADMLTTVAKIVLTSIMIQHSDTELLTPHLLPQDQDRLKDHELSKEELAELHKKAGKSKRGLGWDLGKKLTEDAESEGHTRNGVWIVQPHGQTYWTGKGSEIPVWKMRKGWVSHLEQAKKMPTGYEEDEREDN